MRPKYTIVLVMIMIVVLGGCSRRQNAAGIMEDQSSVSEENGKSSTKERKSQSDTNEKNVDENNYYKICISDAELDYREIISFLTGSSWNGNNEGFVDIDGIQHSWMIEDKTFTYRNNRENGTVNEVDVRKTADDCVKNLNLGVELDTAPSCTKDENGNYTVTYTLAYEGIPIMGNKNVYLPSDSERPVHGAYIEITVGESGIQHLFISNLIKPREILETYPEEKMLSETEISKYIKVYDQQFEDDSNKLGVSIDTISLIYMPYRENTKKTLVPVFDIKVSREQNDNQEILMDSMTGYIYYAG